MSGITFVLFQSEAFMVNTHTQRERKRERDRERDRERQRERKALNTRNDKTILTDSLIE